MKKVLIVGENSYIGENFVNHCKNYFEIETINAKDDNWKAANFTKFEIVLHLAGIAHVSEDKDLSKLYYKVNRDLAIEVATYAKSQGVKQFIFMSSMIIYGKDGKVGKQKEIVTGEEYSPINAYGNSKLEADLAIQKLKSDSFFPVIIRTPVVYGKDCKGNFPKLLQAGKKMIFFPKVKNARSMIYIKNLCEFLKMIIENESEGVFYPQNAEYVSTSDVVKKTSELLNRKIWCSKLAYPAIWIMSKFFNSINKVFGNKTYEKSLSQTFDKAYQIIDFNNSLKECLGIEYEN